MCTDRQRLYLRDLGVDPTTPLDGLPKDVASEWIDELKELVGRASLPVGQRLSREVVKAVGGRDNALQKPARTLPVTLPCPSNSSTANRSEITDRATPSAPPADESWWRLELQATVAVGEGRSVTVSVGGSEHHRRALSEEDAQALAKRVRNVLEGEVARSREDPVASRRA